MTIKRGIIVSIQGYSKDTTKELALEVISAGATAIRTDKPIKIAMDKRVPIIGLYKIKVNDMARQPYITPDTRTAEEVARWSDLVAVDCRKLNQGLGDVLDFCHANKIPMVADVGSWEDYVSLKESGACFSYITTALSVYRKRYLPDVKLAIRLAQAEPGRVIAEGNYRRREDVQEVLKAGVHSVCIGAAITGVYKLARKFTTLEF